MSHTYADRKRSGASPSEQTEALSQPSMAALRSGAVQPTREQMGHRVDLPDTMREKMESAFGADLSAVKLYESQAVADAGAGAMARGSDIAFAPGMLDFTSFGGQALLGHEISHVVSQARGEVTGGGFLNDHALEARADREGAMAAAGQQIAMPTGPMTTVSAADAAGPMQAGDKEDRYTREANEYRKQEGLLYDEADRAKDPEEKARLKKQYQEMQQKKAGRLQKLGKSEEDIQADNARVTSVPQQMMRSYDKFIMGDKFIRPPDKGYAEEKKKRYTGYIGDLQRIQDNMSDDELRNSPGVQKGMVDAYAAAYRAGLGGNRSQGAFMEGDGKDLLGTMYTRMMGTDEISRMLHQNEDSAAKDITQSIKGSGIRELMQRQQDRTVGIDRTYFNTNALDDEANTMRAFWSKGIIPSVWDSPVATRRAKSMQDTMTNLIPNEAIHERHLHHYIDRTNKELTAESGADYLMAITPPRPGMTDIYPGPKPLPPEPDKSITETMSPKQLADWNAQLDAQAADAAKRDKEEKAAAAKQNEGLGHRFLRHIPIVRKFLR